MAGEQDIAGGESLGGLSGLTRKAREMSYARNPLNNNELNLDSMERKQGVVAQSEQAKVTQQTTGRGDAARQQRSAQDYQQQQTQQLQGAMGTLGLQLQAAINDFTSGQGASTASATMGEAAAPHLDDKGNWVMPTSGEQVSAGLTDVLAEKQAQQQVLRSKAGELFDSSGQPKDFEDVLAKFADQNGDGVIDANEEAFLQKSFGIVNAIRRLQEVNPSSPEADALRMQLSLEDRDGMVSGLMAAMERYDRVTGLKVSGADAEEYKLRDLLSMGEDELKAELERAVEGSSGLFGGDFEVSLGRQVDESARQYRSAAKEDVAVMNEMTDEAEAWLGEYEGAFEAQRGKLNTMFAGAAEGIVADLDAMKERLSKPQTIRGPTGIRVQLPAQDTAWIDRAKQWFVDMQESVKNGSTDFATVVQQMLSSTSGIAPEARAMLEKWVGQTIGEDAVQKGKIADLVKRISETGMLVDEDGNPKPVTSGQKMQIAHIMADETMTSAQKSEAIQAVVEQASGKLGADLKSDSKYISELIEDGDMTSALDSFRKAMVGSLRDFQGSLIDQFKKEATGRGVAPEDLKGSIKIAVDEKIKNVTLAADAALKATKGVLETADRDMKETNAMLVDARKMVQRGAALVKENLQKALDANVERYAGQMEEVLKGYPGAPVGDIKSKARAYGFLQMLRGKTGPLYAQVKAQHPSIDKYIDNPNLALGLSAADMQSVSVLNQWANTVNTSAIFTKSETGMSLLDPSTGYISRLTKANAAASKAQRDAQSLWGKIDGEKNVAISKLNKTMNVSPTDLFNAAKSGQAVDFENFDASGLEKRFADLGTKAQFTEDATNLNVDWSGVGEFAAPDETVSDLKRYVAPPPPPPPKQDVVPRKDKEPVTRNAPPPSTVDTYRVTLRDGTTETVYVPKGEDPRRAMAAKGGEFAGGQGVGYEKVTPLGDLGDAISRGWETVKGAFSREGGEGERGGSSRDTPVREKPEPRRSTKDQGSDR